MRGGRESKERVTGEKKRELEQSGEEDRQLQGGGMDIDQAQITQQTGTSHSRVG
jgi:hypothetical protein